MKMGDCLIGERGALRVILEVHEDHIAVTLRDMAANNPIGKILGATRAPIDDNFAQAKEQAVLLIGREFNAHADEEFNRIRKSISWTPVLG